MSHVIVMSLNVIFRARSKLWLKSASENLVPVRRRKTLPASTLLLLLNLSALQRLNKVHFLAVSYPSCPSTMLFGATIDRTDVARASIERLQKLVALVSRCVMWLRVVALSSHLRLAVLVPLCVNVSAGSLLEVCERCNCTLVVRFAWIHHQRKSFRQSVRSAPQTVADSIACPAKAKKFQ